MPAVSAWTRLPRALRWTLVATAAIVAGVLLLAFFDWNRLRGPIAGFASERLGRTVRIDGPLDVDLLSLAPRVTVEDVKVANPAWAGGGTMLQLRRATAQLQLPALLKGDVILSLVSIEEPVLDLRRDPSGRANWQFGRTGQPRAEPAPAPDLPAVHRFVVKDGRLRVTDAKRKLTFAGTVAALEKASRADTQPFELDGKGELNGAPFRLRLSGGPLVNVDPDRPYPFQASIRAGDTQVDADGVIPRPFDLGRFQLSLAAKGQDLADLYYLSSVALPNTPPYALSGRLERAGTRFMVQGLAGRVGNSDLRGEVSIETAKGRPVLTGSLASSRLDLDDLAASLGATPRARRAAVTAGQPAVAQPRLLPDANLQAERVRGMDADVRYRAEAVKVRRVPFRQVSMHVKLANGVLKLDPVSFDFPQGSLTGTVQLDARGRTPQSAVDFRLTGMQLQSFLKKPGAEPPLEGTLQGRVRLQGRGPSVRAFASTADGTVTAVIPHGEVREAFAELTGINVARGIGLLFSEDRQATTLRCGIADFQARDGTLEARTLLADTDVVLITGRGKIDLDREQLDISIQGAPKKLRLVRVRAPIEIRGPLRRPKIGIKEGRALGQAGVAAALGAVLSPLASILAFVDPGLAEDANCAGLLALAKQKGAPVRTAESPGGARPR